MSAQRGCAPPCPRRWSEAPRRHRKRASKLETPENPTQNAGANGDGRRTTLVIGVRRFRIEDSRDACPCGTDSDHCNLSEDAPAGNAIRALDSVCRLNSLLLWAGWLPQEGFG